MDWDPTWTMPMTGTRVPRYQDHPTARYGNLLNVTRQATLTAASTASEIARVAASTEAGYG